jgi:hypothetical protein
MPVPDQSVQSATLMVWGGDPDPQGITRSLRMRPSRSWRKGERQSYKSNGGSTHEFKSIHQWSGWKRWLSDRERRRPVERQVQLWVSRLRPHAAALRRLRSRGINVEINCCVIWDTSVSVRLSHELISSLAVLGVDLDIKWYAPLRAHSARPKRRH